MPSVLAALLGAAGTSDPAIVAATLRAVARALEDDAAFGDWSYGVEYGLPGLHEQRGFVMPTGRERTTATVVIPRRYLTGG